MKTKLLNAIFAFVGSSVYSQTYFPFPDSPTHATWSVEHGYYDITWGNQVIASTTFYGINGDKVIDANSYVKIYSSGSTQDSVFNDESTRNQFQSLLSEAS